MEQHLLAPISWAPHNLRALNPWLPLEKATAPRIPYQSLLSIPP
jgi:hypothetical protein